MTGRRSIKWADVLVAAASIVRSYDTSVTLRQLFYRLVSNGTLANTDTSYKTLSARTAEARRAGTFPALMDRKRSIEQDSGWADAGQALRVTARWFRLDRTTGQPYNVLLAVEKDGLVTQLRSWFDDRGLPVTALQGYSGQSHADNIKHRFVSDPRPAVLLYAGDWDPSGEDIVRDFVERTDCWDHVIRVGLTADQLAEYDLPEMPGKKTDSRAAGFIERHGRLAQVEIDALDPRDLRRLFEEALAPFWDKSAYQAVLEDEARQRDKLTEFAEGWAA